jgi:hypothetical protein
MKGQLIRALLARATAPMALFLAAGCHPSEDAANAAAQQHPNVAASQLQQVFQTAAPADKQYAETASEAMRKGEYEKAVVSLQAIGSGTNITFEQGLAIHNSVVAMEANLIRAMESGDENAKRAYQLLRELKRN